MKREKTGDGDFFSWGCLIAILGFMVFVVFVVFLGMRSMIRVYTSFGDEEIEIIDQRLGITIKESTTPVKLKWIRGRDPVYYLWLENIDEPEGFMENCYDGTYSVVENVQYLKEFGEGREYDYDNNFRLDSAYIAYNCARHDEYNIVFYKDGDSYKAKVYAADR